MATKRRNAPYPLEKRPEKLAEVAAEIKQGSTTDAAVKKAGISFSQYYLWRDAAKKKKKPGPKPRAKAHMMLHDLSQAPVVLSTKVTITRITCDTRDLQSTLAALDA